MPTACAAITGREWSSVRIAIENPSPSAPTMRSAGIRHVVQDDLTRRRPLDAHLLLGLAERDARVVAHHQERRDAFRTQRGVARVANTRYACDTPAPVMKRFVPFSTTSSPSRSYRVVMAAASEPAPGLGERVRHQDVATADALRHGPPLLVGAGQHQRDHAELGDDRRERDAGRHARQLLDEYAERERPAARTPVRLGVADTHQVVLDQGSGRRPRATRRSRRSRRRAGRSAPPRSGERARGTPLALPAARSDGRPSTRLSQTTRRMISASPCPPPPQSAAAPRSTPRRRISIASVRTSRAPLAPIG